MTNVLVAEFGGIHRHFNFLPRVTKWSGLKNDFVVVVVVLVLGELFLKIDVF